MTETDFNEEDFNEEEKSRSSGTDRASGEYHYKNGQTERIYTDANYYDASESTVPPRYYTPPVRPGSGRVRGKGSKGVKTAAICLACALIGGICGAAAATGLMMPGIKELRGRVDSMPVVSVPEQTKESAAPIAVYTPGSGLSASDIYELACRQTVGIRSDVTYYNFFGMRSSSAVSGSGFVLTENGYIMTNYHVIEPAYNSGSAISVMFRDGSSYKASIVGFEESNDIAVLKIEADGLEPVSFANSGELCVGDEAFPVGNPLGELEFTMTFGRVSALDRVISTGSGNAINMFQIDAAVNSGNSGGPVYNSEGKVTGVVTAKYNSSGVEGLGFAIPANDAVSIANDLITKGYVTGKAYLGVVLDERYTSIVSQYYGMPRGAYVYSVGAGSCSEIAGIQPGDVIVAVGSTRTESANELKNAVRRFHSGDSEEITVYREGSYLKLPVTFDEVRSSNESGV